MAHQVRVLLQRLLVVLQAQVGAAHSRLEPNALVVVDGGLVAAVFKENGHDLVALYYFTGFDLVKSGVSIDCAICCIELASFLKHLGSSLNITSLLINFALQGVELK